MAATEIRKEDVQLPKEFKDCLAFVLYNVFTEEECEEYINISEAKGYSTALINTGGNGQELKTDIRNNSRCIWDTFEEVDKIWKRIEPFVPDVWNNRKVIGLNERLRILRYDPGEYFKLHYDGCYSRENGERSYVTIQIYLNEYLTVVLKREYEDTQIKELVKLSENDIAFHSSLTSNHMKEKGAVCSHRYIDDLLKHVVSELDKTVIDEELQHIDDFIFCVGFEGGSTTFLDPLSDERVEVVPKTGSVLIFEHRILHEGSELISGRKYAIRTDVMYSSKVIRSHKNNESSIKEMTSQENQKRLEELEEERCKPS